MEYINNDGKWTINKGVSLLIEPTLEWRYKNQGAWLEVVQIDRTINIKVYALNNDIFNIIIGSEDTVLDVVDNETNINIELDSDVQIGDTLSISGTHPIYGYTERIVTINE